MAEPGRSAAGSDTERSNVATDHMRNCLQLKQLLGLGKLKNHTCKALQHNGLQFRETH